MFHKALWLRQWKQGKYMILLFLLTSLYMLPYEYYTRAKTELYHLTTIEEDYTHYYSYFFNPFESSLPQGIILIALACILIGWERNNQSSDFLFSMPFKRKDIFFTKWLFGVVTILAVNLICWISMYGIKTMTIHNEYQNFKSFHIYFLYITVIFIAVYTFALFVGTIAGNAFSQGGLTGILLCLPFALLALTYGFLSVHMEGSVEKLSKRHDKVTDSVLQTNIVSPLVHFHISYNYHPDTEFDEEGNIISETPKKDPMEGTRIPSIWTILAPIIYIIVFLPLGAFLYARTPNEQNGNLLLFPKLKSLFLSFAVLCSALTGGFITSQTNSLLSYYIGFSIAGIASYFIFQQLLKLRVSFGAK
ncbi:acetoin ABC transporter permease [Bacillus manliponensis]|uniref:Acetoin ABC transporter permease n=1 Tax=Bacillus manliponensis TaxID=574376 RepID=A0A073K188_9BACI|nr:ABC-2 transporter permease [Bacillus manliponensis]KEK21069.1 acetoin ABC transporter permease [Bacillus manliponensis]